jgi:3-hydroxyisobutyrate dehydrogenase-like beta-hydroxyacid dehydrogenase
LCDIIQIFVSDDEALIATVEGLKRSLQASHVVMAHSTVAPHTIRAAAEIVQRRGAQFLDAPFTGSKVAAEKGELVYYLGGDDATFLRARPVLEASSKEIIEIGEIGHATVIKLATNMITATTVQAAAEALALVDSAGVSPDKFAAAMSGNGSQSATLAMKLPNMISGNFEQHFSTKNMLKDVQIASRLARSHGLHFVATEAARDSLLAEIDAGRGDFDYASMVRVFFPDGIQRRVETEVKEGQQSLVLDETPAVDSREESKLETDDCHDSATESLRPESGAREIEEKAVNAAIDVRHADTDLAGDIESDIAANDTGHERSEAGAAMPHARDNADGSPPIEPEKSAAAREVEAVGANVAGPTGDDKGESNDRRGFFSRVFGRGTDD